MERRFVARALVCAAAPLFFSVFSIACSAPLETDETSDEDNRRQVAIFGHLTH